MIRLYYNTVCAVHNIGSRRDDTGVIHILGSSGRIPRARRPHVRTSASLTPRVSSSMFVEPLLPTNHRTDLHETADVPVQSCYLGATLYDITNFGRRSGPGQTVLAFRGIGTSALALERASRSLRCLPSTRPGMSSSFEAC
jgi:hypothetical protein